MNWAEYERAKQALRIHPDEAPSLTMSGVAGDNATRYLEKQKGTVIPNDERLFATHGITNSDFVWTGGANIRAHIGFSTGGHPALAGFDTIYCAGVVKRDYFFFHSGHYHPQLENALHFFVAFVDNTCATLAGGVRDAKVDQLCRMRLKLYVKGSSDETYSTNFALIAGGDEEPTTMATSTTGGIPRSMPISMGPQMSAPRGIGSMAVPQRTATTTTTTITALSADPPRLSSTTADDSSGAVFAETGINGYARQQLQVREHGAPRWIEDNSVTKCLLCKKTFGTFTRKHHCRRCGQIVCADCSSHTKMVKNPAVKPKATEAEKQPVRVCDTCYNSQDLL